MAARKKQQTQSPVLYGVVFRTPDKARVVHLEDSIDALLACPISGQDKRILMVPRALAFDSRLLMEYTDTAIKMGKAVAI